MGLLSNASPTFTDKTLPDQSGKVFIVTGATSGVGELLAGILYSKNGNVYIAARSAAKAEATINKLMTNHPGSKGVLTFLHLDLNDLTTVKASANKFLAAETKLNVLFNNAGVMFPAEGSKTQQGYEQQLGTNVLAPQLFTNLLTPVLKETAKTQPADTVRVVWVSSSAAANFAPKGGVEMDNLDYSKDKGGWHKYGTSKAGNIFQASEFARRHGSNNIISVSLDPGNLKTPLWQTSPFMARISMGFFLKDPIYGAYTELFAGFSSAVKMSDSGRFIKPFGAIGNTRDDIETSRKPASAGGNGIAEAFYDWVEKQIAPYA